MPVGVSTLLHTQRGGTPATISANLGKPWRKDLSPPEPRTPCPEFVPI